MARAERKDARRQSAGLRRKVLLLTATLARGRVRRSRNPSVTELIALIGPMHSQFG